MPKSTPHLWPKPPVMLCYAVAALSVTAALLIARWLESNSHTAPVSLFLCAVMLSAWFGGIGPGVLAVVLSFLAFAYHFEPPVYSLAMEVLQIPRFLIFVLSALYVVPPVFPRSHSRCLGRSLTFTLGGIYGNQRSFRGVCRGHAWSTTSHLCFLQQRRRGASGASLVHHRGP